MHTRRPPALALLALLLGTALGVGAAAPTDDGMVHIPAGIYEPLYAAPNDPKRIDVPAFAMDRWPVTNGDFLEFVRANPSWRKSRVKRLFADVNYLKHWAGDEDLGSQNRPDQPVVWISWFAAKAYAAWKNKRLPTVAEWEYAAAASPTRPDGRADTAFQRALRHWYSTPAPTTLPRVGAGLPNFYGLHDMHGLIWEWTSDFNSELVSGDARGDTGIDRQLFCAAGSLSARDTENFPAFMRSGFRSSLKAAYTVHNLGFRCVRDLAPKTTADPAAPPLAPQP